MTAVPPRSADPRQEVGDLLELVHAFGKRPRSYRVISTITSEVEPRTTVLIELEDGSRMKGRRFRTEERARKAEQIGALIGPAFSRILARRGNVTLEEWIEGVPMATRRPVDPALMRRCGFTLGSLHEVAAGAVDPSDPVDPREFLTRLDAQTQALVRSCHLTPEEGARALEIGRRCAPEQATSSIVHLDYCAENIVMNESGAPVCIDNTRLDHGPRAFDLARTWYRWPMSAGERSHFVEGYRDASIHPPVDECFAFWALVALVGATTWRLRVAPRSSDVPRQRLKTLLSWLAKHGGTRPDRVFWEAFG